MSSQPQTVDTRRVVVTQELVTASPPGPTMTYTGQVYRRPRSSAFKLVCLPRT